ncbi:MAG: class I SAM-dependent methyltransferase [Spirosomataceae bacterium]
MLTFSDSEKEFIRQHLQADVSQLMLRNKSIAPDRLRVVVQQIQARQKAKDKLPTWFAHLDVVFPSLLSVEQSSSELTARYKSRLLQGTRFVDLTGGMGVDFQAISQGFVEAFYVERNAELTQLTAHNLARLGSDNAQFITQDSLTWLQETSLLFDWIYLDPARRGDINQKLVRLEDCEPNVFAIKSLLFEKSSKVLLKASPLLDIEGAVRALGCVAQLHVLAVENEVKEILFILQANPLSEATITAINLTKKGEQVFSFRRSDEQNTQVAIGIQGNYLYEPNAAVMKSGAFKQIAKVFGLTKMHVHSHLYTSDQQIDEFPGRRFEIIAITKLDKRELRKHLPNAQANIAVRNFPLTVAQIRQQTGIREGGEVYLFATTDAQDKKIVVVTKKA